MAILSAAHIEQLKILAASASVNPFERELASLRLSLIDLPSNLSRTRIVQFCEKYLGSGIYNDASPRMISLCIAEQLFDVATSIIRRSGLLSSELALSVSNTKRLWRSVVQIHFHDRQFISCAFDQELFSTEHAEMYILRWIHTFPLINSFLTSTQFEPGWVDISVDDHGVPPGLSFCDRRTNSFLIPDCDFLRTHGYESTRQYFSTHYIDWHARRPVAIWRGTTSGRREDMVSEDVALGWRSLPRIRLCEIASEHPSLFDVGTSGITQISDAKSIEEIRSSGLMRKPIPANKFNMFKYQIDIDGNTNSWAGLFQKLLTGSPVLKVLSPGRWRQWYYNDLKPWVNYVPVDSGMSDLVEKVEWLRANDEIARRIGERGEALARSIDYEHEVKRSASTIAAAIRYLAKLPEVSLKFGIDCDGNSCLREGWSEPEPDVVWVLNFESKIQIAGLICLEDYVISLDLSPWQISPKFLSQQISVVVNGQLLNQTELSERTTILCLLPKQIGSMHKDLSIMLLHPRTITAASITRPLDDRLLSIGLHALTLTPASVYTANEGTTLPPRYSR